MIKRLRPLAAVVAVLILLGWAMGVLVLHVAHGFFHGEIDRPVSRWVHAHHSHALGAALDRVAHFGSNAVVLVVALAAGGIWAVRRRRMIPLVALAASYGGGAVIALAVKVAVRRGQSGLPGGFTGLTELGFPSGHATLGAAVYGTMAVLLARRRLNGEMTGAEPDGRQPRWRRRWQEPRRWIVPAGLVLLALIIGVARVYNGQHDSTDVLAGWILGGLWAWAVGAFGPGAERRTGTARSTLGEPADCADPAPPSTGPRLARARRTAFRRLAPCRAALAGRPTG